MVPAKQRHTIKETVIKQKMMWREFFKKRPNIHFYLKGMVRAF